MKLKYWSLVAASIFTTASCSDRPHCAFTTDPTEAPLFRIAVEPTPENGLVAESRMMMDKITTVPKAKLGSLVGRLSDEDVLRLNRAILVFLGLGASARSRR